MGGLCELATWHGSKGPAEVEAKPKPRPRPRCSSLPPVLQNRRGKDPHHHADQLGDIRVHTISRAEEVPVDKYVLVHDVRVGYMRGRRYAVQAHTQTQTHQQHVSLCGAKFRVMTAAAEARWHSCAASAAPACLATSTTR